jgi:sialate O-acetylesterase
MSFRRIQSASLAAGLLFAASIAVFAQPTPGQAAAVATAKALPFVSPIFGDNMVLQRGKLNTIWGWSEPGDNVRVQIG